MAFFSKCEMDHVMIWNDYTGPLENIRSLVSVADNTSDPIISRWADETAMLPPTGLNGPYYTLQRIICSMHSM